MDVSSPQEPWRICFSDIEACTAHHQLLAISCSKTVCRVTSIRESGAALPMTCREVWRKSAIMYNYRYRETLSEFTRLCQPRIGTIR